jgi:HNH endonuclease
MVTKSVPYAAQSLCRPRHRNSPICAMDGTAVLFSSILSCYFSKIYIPTMTNGRLPRPAVLDADRAYYSSRHWREVARPAALSARPLCEHCELRGVVQAATQVDHIIRPKGDRYLQRDPNNLQCLCTRCHQDKSHWERRNDGRPLRVGIAVDGWPIELRHGCSDWRWWLLLEKKGPTCV